MDTHTHTGLIDNSIFAFKVKRRKIKENLKTELFLLILRNAYVHYLNNPHMFPSIKITTEYR